MKKKLNKKPSENLIYSNFKTSWNLVFQNLNYIYIAIFLFLLFFILALAFQIPPSLDQQIKLLLQKLVLRTENLDTFQLISYIFVNNLGVAIMAIVFGLFFCLAPILIAASNGYVLGYLTKLLVSKLGLFHGISSLWRILPHGVFELPAIFIGLALGIKFGVIFIKSLNENSFKNFIKFLIEVFKIILYVIIPLLVIAAFIEGFLISFF